MEVFLKATELSSRIQSFLTITKISTSSSVLVLLTDKVSMFRSLASVPFQSFLFLSFSRLCSTCRDSFIGNRKILTHAASQPSLETSGPLFRFVNRVFTDGTVFLLRGFSMVIIIEIFKENTYKTSSYYFSICIFFSHIAFSFLWLISYFWLRDVDLLFCALFINDLVLV